MIEIGYHYIRFSLVIYGFLFPLISGEIVLKHSIILLYYAILLVVYY